MSCYCISVATRTASCALITPAAKQLEEEQKYVQDVEEDARSDRNCAGEPFAPQAVEIENREAAENCQSGNRPDHVGVRDRDEQLDDPEHDQRDQSPEQGARPRRQVT